MFYFIIPLRDSSTTDDWPGICRLLQRTLQSASGQLHADFQILVVGHSLPDGFSLPPRCEFIPVDFDPPQLSSDMDTQRRLWFMRGDKGRKILHGLARAREDSGSYVMFLDADDLVSNRLAGYVAENQGANGWYFEKGYRLDDGPCPRLFWRNGFYQECGSSYILRTDIAPFPDELDDNADFDHYFVRRYVAHAYIKENMEALGTLLAPLPFYGSVYTFNGRNMFAATSRRMDSPIRRMARNLIKTRRIGRPIQDEFGLVSGIIKDRNGLERRSNDRT